MSVENPVLIVCMYVCMHFSDCSRIEADISDVLSPVFCTCVYICVYVCMYILIYNIIYVYIHTYIIYIYNMYIWWAQKLKQHWQYLSIFTPQENGRWTTPRQDGFDQTKWIHVSFWIMCFMYTHKNTHSNAYTMRSLLSIHFLYSIYARVCMCLCCICNLFFVSAALLSLLL